MSGRPWQTGDVLRSSRNVLFGTVPVLILLAVPGFAVSANASEGSVPAVVSAYAGDPNGLLTDLDDVFGVAASGQGIDFTGAEVGQLNRVFDFADSFLNGSSVENPVVLSNVWTAPISIGEKPFGLATIWINPDSQNAELADFVVDPDAALALADVPAGTYLVGDPDRSAWLALTEGELTALVAGDSGLTSGTSLAAYQKVIQSEPVEPAPTHDSGLLNSILVLVAGLIVVAVGLGFYEYRRRSRALGDEEVLLEQPEPLDLPLENETKHDA